MTLHFTIEEFETRQKVVRKAMIAEGLDGLLIFKQESMYYLTGYDTSGYTMFQGMWMGADGRLALLTRSADRLQSRMTSTLEDIRIWVDGDGANPGNDLRDMIADYGARGKRIGVEYHAYGLTAQRGKMVDAALAGFCVTVDASDIVRLVRLVKSPAELAYVRKAGALCDEAWNVANTQTVPGAFLGDVYGEMLRVIMAGDGDPSASRWPMGAGENALMVRYHTGKETVSDQDQIQHEFAATYRHYHAAAMSVVTTGTPRAEHLSMFSACRDTLSACQDNLRPGRTVGEVFETHNRVLGAAGYGHAALNACGYTLGIAYPPTWMDWPMIWAGNPQVIEAGMVFFIHIILLDDRTGCSMALGETAIVTEGGPDRINHAPPSLIVN
ncbi:aminopeptidase P family protein [Rhodobacteraceae bacterium NNCM2]|nr:aminopeptidase P family protein [Coraliihabitans acroporae]